MVGVLRSHGCLGSRSPSDPATTLMNQTTKQAFKCLRTLATLAYYALTNNSQSANALIGLMRSVKADSSFFCGNNLK